MSVMLLIPGRTEAAVRILGHSVEAFGTHPIGPFGLSGGGHSALPGGDIFGYVEAETGNVANVAYLVPVPRAFNTMGGIFNDKQATPPGDIEDRAHVTGATAEMHRQQRLGARSDGIFNAVFVDIEGLRVYVDEHRTRTGMKHHVGRGGERHRRRDHLITGTHPECEQGQVEGGRA
jgi:hypothetical protein